MFLFVTKRCPAGHFLVAVNRTLTIKLGEGIFTKNMEKEEEDP